MYLRHPIAGQAKSLVAPSELARKYRASVLLSGASHTRSADLHGKTFTANGGIGRRAGRIYADGTDDYLSIPYTADNTFSSQIGHVVVVRIRILSDLSTAVYRNLGVWRIADGGYSWHYFFFTGDGTGYQPLCYGTPYGTSSTGTAAFSLSEIGGRSALSSWHTFVLRRDSSTSASLWVDGLPCVRYTGFGNDIAGPPSGDQVLFVRAPDNLSNWLNAEVDVFGVLDSDKVPDSVCRALSANPWQLFEPRRIWLPYSAGGGGSTYEVSLSEAAAATDAPAAALSAGVAATESATAADTPAAVLVLAVASSESAAAADTAAAGLTAVAAAAESASAADTPAATMLAGAAAAEAASAADEVIAGAATYGVTIAEAASAADTASALATLVASASETLAAADSVTVTMVMGAAVSEAAGAADAANWGGATYSMAIDETATLADAVASALQALAAMQENAAAGEQVVAILSAGAGMLEAATAADVASSAWQTTVLITEPAAASDTVAESAGGVITAALAEAANAADVVVAALIRGFVAITVAPRRRISAGEERPANLSAGGRPRNLPPRGR